MAEQKTKPDPLKLLTIGEVVRRTGLSRSTIFRELAKDRAARTPGRHFAAPVNRPDGKLVWREVTLVRWFEMREGVTA